MSKKPLDPNLASILDSIRATVGGETAPPSEDAQDAMLAAESEASPEGEDIASAQAGSETRTAENPARKNEAKDAPAPPGKPSMRKAIPPATRSVEDFLADLIRPQVEAWLSAHLPEIIQKQAADEIARLTGKKSG